MVVLGIDCRKWRGRKGLRRSRGGGRNDDWETLVLYQMS
jgi:hypothetical protein